MYHAHNPAFPLSLLVFFQLFSTQSYFRRIRTLHLVPTVLPDHNWHLRALCIPFTVSAGNYMEKAAGPPLHKRQHAIDAADFFRRMLGYDADSHFIDIQPVR